MYIVSADGACRGNQYNKNIGSWSFAIWDENDNLIYEDKNVKNDTTNNCMELTAFLNALKYIVMNNITESKILLDSAYVFNSVDKKWVFNWEKENFVYRKDASGYRPNYLLWKEVLAKLKEAKDKNINISLEKVKGHNDDKYNEYVDKLCNDIMDNPPRMVSFNKIEIDDLFDDESDDDNNFIDVDNIDKSGIQIINETDLTHDQKEAIYHASHWYNDQRKTDPVFVVGGTAGSGKAIPEDTLVPTPDGEKRFGDLKVNDYLFDRRGKKTKVTAIYPQGMLDNYEITFLDGRKANSSIDHLWSYITNEGTLRTVELSEILEDYKNHQYFIPVNKAVEYPEKKLFLPPYLYGYLICGPNLNHFLNVVKEWIANNPNVSDISEISHGVWLTLNEMLSGSSILPDYINCSIEQRMDLIRGVMDSNGSISKKGKMKFKSSNFSLVLQIKGILCSLGYTSLFSIDKSRNYVLIINAPNDEKVQFFKLENKRKIANERKNLEQNKLCDRIGIRDIRYTGERKMMCVDVDNDEHLFLMNNYIVTHNCLHEDSELFYEDGIRKIKDVQVGDKIYGNDGKLCKVTNVFHQNEKKECYKITFNDDTNITCDLDQLFSFSTDGNNFNVDNLKAIKELFENSNVIYFPMNRLLRFPKKRLKLPSSFIGILLNYDCTDIEFFNDYFTLYLNNSLIHSNDKINEIAEVVKQYGYKLNTISFGRGVVSFTATDKEKANEFKSIITSMNLIDNGHKHIPFEYVYSHIKDRTLLLNSMLNINIINRNDISVKISQGLKKDIRLLVETMGGQVYCKDDNELSIILPRTSSEVDTRNLVKYIKKIEKLDDKYNTVCITVNNKSKLYVSNDCVVVHNTSIIPHFINNINLKPTGHALPYNAKVLKPNGFVPIVTLKVGDVICGGNGRFVKVKGIYPQGEREMYKVYFSDGASTICDKDHLWTVATLQEKFLTYSLGEILDKGLTAPTGRVKYRIPLVQPVQFNKKKLPIHPYLLGALINGDFRRGDVITFRTRHREIVPKIKNLLAQYNFKLSEPITKNDNAVEERYVLSKTDTIVDNWLNEKLHELGLRNIINEERFIPPIYLFSSVEQRRQLLNGIIDTLGNFAHKSDELKLKSGNKHAFTVEFTSKSMRLLKDIKFLVESLGGLTDIHNVSANNKQVAKNVFVNTFEGWYKMSIKVRTFGMTVYNGEFNRCNLNKVLLERTITKVEKLDKKIEAICIEVDEPNGLFVTNDFIVTHNTTVSNKVAYVAPTGRAAMILQKKGIPATTIHKLIYNYVVEKDLKGNVKKAYFELKNKLPVGLKLIVVDEFSMVSSEVMKDLMSFKIPIIMFGDPFQLQPVGGNINPYANKFNIMLTEIHRQAADNPILRLATDVRNGNEILKYGDFGNLKIIPKAKLSKDVMLSADQIICGTNRSRQDINNSIRRHFCRTSLLPEEGDKVICLKNNWTVPPIDDFYLVNGMIGFINYLSIDKYGKPIFDFTPDFLNSSFMKLRYEPKIFLGEPVDPKKLGRFANVTQFDYGYAITCHKAQGGEFNNVVVWEEAFSREERLNWLYTAITRAKNSLIIYH